MALQGHLESIQEDGLVGGWCWNAANPAERVRLEVMVDNDIVGHTLANVFRADLEAAGIGDGAHAFSFLLPWSAIASKSVCTVRVCEAGSRHPIGGALTYRRGALIPLEQRMIELERGMRVLHARLADANERAAREASLLRGMLGTIGSFFTQLSDMPPDALSVEGAFGIGALLAQTRTQHEPFALAAPEAPAVTICVTGEGSLAEAYGCLRALHRTGVDAAAEIVLLDTGLSAELALLPSLVQNLRTWRLAPGESAVSVCNRIARATAGAREAVILLSPGVRMTEGWLPALRAAFVAYPDCAVIAPAVLRADGTVQSSGLLPDRAGRLADVAYAERADFPWLDRVIPVAAASETAVAIRGSAFQALDGLSPDFGEFTASLTDFCLRCWEAGQSVLYQPQCRLGWSETSGLGGFGAAARDLGLAAELAARWDGTPRLAWPRPIGRALLLEESGAGTESQILGRAATLQRLGYEVIFADTAGLDREPAAGSALRAMGVAVLRAPMVPSLTTAIETAHPAFALAELSGAAALTLPPETLRPLSPTTRIVLNLAGEGEAVPQAAIDTSDAVLTGDAALAATLGRAKTRGPAVLSLAPRDPESRRGLWLLLEGEEAGQASAEDWLATLLPALAKALPKLQIHTMRQTGAKLPKGVKQHAAAAADAALFGQLRLALAPFKKPAADPAAIAGCLAAGLPVLATAAALGDTAPPAGVQTVAATAQAVTRALRQLVEEDDAWATLAGPLQGGLAGEPLAAAYRAMLAGLPPVKAR